MRQNRLMLLIVINHEKPQHQQPGENTTGNPATQIKVPKSPGDSSRQEKCYRKNVPPASRREIPRKRSCCQYKFFPGSHASLNYRESRAKPFACRCRHLLRRGGGHGCRVKTRKPFLWFTSLRYLPFYLIRSLPSQCPKKRSHGENCAESFGIWEAE